MFGWGQKKDAAVVETVCTRLRPLFGILEHRLGCLPPFLTGDPYVIGYVVGAATIFAQIETSGKATTELKGLVSLSALQSVFASVGFTQQDASRAMHIMAAHPDGRKGARAADLIIGVGAGKTDMDNEPEIRAAKQAVSAMPESIRNMLGGSPQSLLMNELQEQLFFAPLEVKYAKQ